MKKIKKTLLAGLLVALCLTQAGCYGSFKLTNKLHDWNGEVGDKYVNALVFFGLIVVPVYEVAILVDGLVLNTIEFWGGDNPVAMKEGQKDVQIVKKDGKKYRITATKNKFHIEQLEGPEKGQYAELIFDEDSKSWGLKDGDKELQKLVDLNGDVVHIYKPNGDIVEVDANGYDLALIKEQVKSESQVYALN